MNITLALDSKKWENDLKILQKSMPQVIDKALLATAQFGTQIILDRTERGIGYTGAFDSYSAKYALFRKAAGRKTSPVDLNFSGKMLGAMAATKERKGVAKIYFTRASEAAKASGNNRKRPFFGFNRQEQDKLRRFFSNRIKV